MTGPVIYEIPAMVENEFAPEYENYMRGRHIPDLLATGFFTSARFTRSSKNRFRAFYEARSQSALDEYLQKDAARLRADFAAHFPAGVELSREVWTVLENRENED